LRDALKTWELDGFGQVTELLASELVTNALRHVGSPITLRAFRQPSRIRVEVEDTSTMTPVRRDPEPLDPGGRGIMIVESLANDWGADVRDDGKTVWFEIDVSTATSEIHTER
jgi:anti-sigma regulatory factor (Ser/Thr protein kinase)